jgi:hypothetical protein
MPALERKMDETPIRVQHRRGVRGWRMPPNTVSVTRPGKWGNPFDWREVGNAATVEFLQDWLAHPERYPGKPTPPTLDKIRVGLKGKNLACYCKPGSPCHADVLLEIANT